jgi:hypothetical protein
MATIDIHLKQVIMFDSTVAMLLPATQELPFLFRTCRRSSPPDFEPPKAIH